MGAPQSRLIQFVSAIKSCDDVTVTATWPCTSFVTKTISYDEQEFDQGAKNGFCQMLVDEAQWPKFLPYGCGVGIGFPEIEIEVTWMDKICKFRHSYTGSWHLSDYIMSFSTYVYYIYEDGIHVGPESTGFFLGKYKDKRRIIEWKLHY